MNPIFCRELGSELQENKIPYIVVTLVALALTILSTQNISIEYFNGIGSLGSNIAMGVGAGVLVLEIFLSMKDPWKLSRPLTGEQQRAVKSSLLPNQYSLAMNKEGKRVLIIADDICINGFKITEDGNAEEVDISNLSRLPKDVYLEAIKNGGKFTIKEEEIETYKSMLRENETTFIYNSLGTQIQLKNGLNLFIISGHVLKARLLNQKKV